MVDINPTRSIITVNVNKQIKRQILSEQILEKYSTTYYIQEIHFKYKDTDRLKQRGREIYSNIKVTKRKLE